MMALKLASLGHGASGVRPQTIAMLEAMLERGIVPVVPSQGSVGTSGDLAPLAHLAAAMLGIGEAHFAARPCRPMPRSSAPGSHRSCSAQGRARAAQRHPVLDR